MSCEQSDDVDELRMEDRDQQLSDSKRCCLKICTGKHVTNIQMCLRLLFTPYITRNSFAHVLLPYLILRRSSELLLNKLSWEVILHNPNIYRVWIPEPILRNTYHITYFSLSESPSSPTVSPGALDVEEGEKLCVSSHLVIFQAVVSSWSLISFVLPCQWFRCLYGRCAPCANLVGNLVKCHDRVYVFALTAPLRKSFEIQRRFIQPKSNFKTRNNIYNYIRHFPF